VGRDSSVCIATRYGLSSPRIESRWGARFSAHFETGLRAYLTYTMGTGSFPGVKRPGRGADHPPSIWRRSWRKSRVIYLLPIWAFVACSWVNFTFIRPDHSVLGDHCGIELYRIVWGLISTVKATRCTIVSNLFYFGMTLYIFRTVFPSIIRSSRLYIQQQAFVKQILLSAC